MIVNFEIPQCIIMLIGLLFLAIFRAYKDIDLMLNYSMKRKVKWGPFKYLYMNNRLEETLGGPVLDDPNCGIYFPVFMLILAHSAAVLTSIIWSIILIVRGYTVSDVKIMFNVTLGMTLIVIFASGILSHVYKNKYVNNKAKYIRKIKRQLEEKNK